MYVITVRQADGSWLTRRRRYGSRSAAGRNVARERARGAVAQVRHMISEEGSP